MTLTGRGRGAPIEGMRRTSAFCLALGYALSWLVVCLSTCLMESPAAKHACCSQGPGIRAVQRDCCSSAPTARPDSAPGISAPIASAAAPLAVAVLAYAPAACVLPVRVAASPPLVLRI